MGIFDLGRVMKPNEFDVRGTYSHQLSVTVLSVIVLSVQHKGSCSVFMLDYSKLASLEGQNSDVV